MKSDTLSLCRSYVSAQTTHPSEHALGQNYATITLSRQAGARGRTIGKLLRQELNLLKPPKAVPWILFDRDLMARVMADHDLPHELSRFFPEARWNEFDSTINMLLKRHPDAWTIFEHTIDTIHKLGRLGHAIIVGRGANFATQGCQNALHVRLVGAYESRLEHMCVARCLGEKVARAYLESEDKNRRAFVRQHFDADIEDPKYYSMILNTDHLTNKQVVKMLTQWVTLFEHERTP